MTIILRHPGSISTDRRSDAAHMCRLVLSFDGLIKAQPMASLTAQFFTPNNSIKNSQYHSACGSAAWIPPRTSEAQLNQTVGNYFIPGVLPSAVVHAESRFLNFIKFFPADAYRGSR